MGFLDDTRKRDSKLWLEWDDARRALTDYPALFPAGAEDGP